MLHNAQTWGRLKHEPRVKRWPAPPPRPTRTNQPQPLRPSRDGPLLTVTLEPILYVPVRVCAYAVWAHTIHTHVMCISIQSIILCIRVYTYVYPYLCLSMCTCVVYMDVQDIPRKEPRAWQIAQAGPVTVDQTRQCAVAPDPPFELC